MENKKNNKQIKQHKKDTILVWKADGEKKEKKKTHKNSYKKPYKKTYNNNNKTPKEKIPQQDIQNVCDYCLFLSIEQYFEDIALESENFIFLSKKVGFIKENFVEKIQKQCDEKIKLYMKKISNEFKNAKVEFIYKRNSIIVSDGIITYTFIAIYENGQVKIQCRKKEEED
jgi:hypothetical protein